MPRRVLLSCLILAVSAVFLERLIVTDREAIRALVTGASEDASRGDWGAFSGRFDPQIRVSGRDPEALAGYVRRLMERLAVRGASAQVREITVEGDAARAGVQVRARLQGGFWVGQVDARFLRQSGTWRIAGLTLPYAGPRTPSEEP